RGRDGEGPLGRRRRGDRGPLARRPGQLRLRRRRAEEGTRACARGRRLTMQLVQLRKHLAPSFAMPFRHREVGGKVLVTSTEGDFLMLSHDEFGAFARGDIEKGTPLYARLAERNFIRAEFDERRMVDRVRARKRFLSWGPNLHIVVVTLRCNETCVYCHASRADMKDTQTDMTKEIAEKTIDKIFAT